MGLRYPAVTAVGWLHRDRGRPDVVGEADTVYAFDTGGGHVRTIGHLRAPLGHAAAFTLGGLAYVAGGRNTAGAAVSSTVSIDPTSGSIVAAPPLRKPVADTAVTSGIDPVLLIGGWAGSTVDRDPDGHPAFAGERNRHRRRHRHRAHLRPSDPTVAASARPFAGLLLIADRGNDRLLVMNAAQAHRLAIPLAIAARPPSTRFYFPDDAFWVHGGHAILVNEEENNLIAEIAYPERPNPMDVRARRRGRAPAPGTSISRTTSSPTRAAASWSPTRRTAASCS